MQGTEETQNEIDGQIGISSVAAINLDWKRLTVRSKQKPVCVRDTHRIYIYIYMYVCANIINK